jgi:hypothetical protein
MFYSECPNNAFCCTGEHVFYWRMTTLKTNWVGVSMTSYIPYGFYTDVTRFPWKRKKLDHDSLEVEVFDSPSHLYLFLHSARMLHAQIKCVLPTLCVCACPRYETLAVATDAESRQDAELPLKTGGKRLTVSLQSSVPRFPFTANGLLN